MIANDVNSRIIGYIKDEREIVLGTCFLFASNYIFTARHVIEKHTGTITCYFEELDYYTSVYIEYENINYDFAILKCINKVPENVSFYSFSITEAERDDDWQSEGYPTINKGIREYANGKIRRILRTEPYVIYELNIEDGKESGEWEGMSGAPLIIDNEIAAIIVKEKESNIKTRLKAISFLGIFQLLEKEKKEILSVIKSGYDPILKARITFFETKINDIFHNFLIEESKIRNECFVLKNTNKCLEKLTKTIAMSIENYGKSIVLYKKAQQGNYTETMEANYEIRERTKQVLKLISSNNQLVYILLWILAEGAKHCPRIGSRILEGIFTDIYIDESNENMNIYFSCGKSNENYLECLEAVLKEIDKYINNNKLSLEDEIIVWDELVVSSLTYENKKRLKQSRENITVGMFVINSFQYYNLYRKEDQFDLNHDYQIKEKVFKQFLIENNESIAHIIAKYTWVSKINIIQFILPFEDLEQFKTELDNYL